jgi:hypothetical protein
MVDAWQISAERKSPPIRIPRTFQLMIVFIVLSLSTSSCRLKLKILVLAL